MPVATSPATAVYMLKILNLKLLQMAPPSASVVSARNEAMEASVTLWMGEYWLMLESTLSDLWDYNSARLIQSIYHQTADGLVNGEVLVNLSDVLAAKDPDIFP